MSEKDRSQYYSCLKNMINQHDQETDIGKCIHFINKIKEHRNSKIKTKHINKFECLYFKRFGYHHIFSRNSQLFNNTDHSLSGQSNVPSNNSTTLPRASDHPPVPVTSMASTPSSSMDPSPTAPTTAPRHPSPSSRYTCKQDDYTKKWVINLSKPPLLQDSYPSYKKVQILLLHPSIPHGSLYNSGGRGFLQTSIQ